MSAFTGDYDYDLPDCLIARHPPQRRDAARMLVVDRRHGTITHHSFRDLPKFLGPEFLAVLNDTRVVKARVFSDDGRVEFLFLEEVADREWIALAKPGRKMRLGDSARVGRSTVTVVEILAAGERRISLDHPIDFELHGALPIPPYMDRQAVEIDGERYQTVFANRPGSVAAPTAGLHFTPDMLAQIPHTFLTLHIGTGTFQPVRSERIDEHRMHEERFYVSEGSAASVNAAARILAVGTTTVRVLESQPPGDFQAGSGRTSIFIHPPFDFHRVTALLTNFHLPKSTLLMLVSAFAGRELILDAYREAIRQEYRFYSYGDCMLVI